MYFQEEMLACTVVMSGPSLCAPGALQPAPNTCAGVGMDVVDQPALLGAATELEVDGQDGAGWEWAARHPLGPPPSPGAALSSHHVMATPCLAISLPSPNPSASHPSQASSSSPFYSCAQDWPHSGQPWSPVLVS